MHFATKTTLDTDLCFVYQFDAHINSEHTAVI